MDFFLGIQKESILKKIYIPVEKKSVEKIIIFLYF
jgi:hypothetical protein